MGDSFANNDLNFPEGPKWEIEFYEDIVSRNPNYVEVLMLLGSLYTGSKMYAKGLNVDQRLAQLKQTDPIVQYNLACSYALVGLPEKAFVALAQAVELGYHDAKHMENDADLNSIRSDPRYAAIISRIQKPKSVNT